jgi:hypothetical protein
MITHPLVSVYLREYVRWTESLSRDKKPPGYYLDCLRRVLQMELAQLGNIWSVKMRSACTI